MEEGKLLSDKNILIVEDEALIRFGLTDFFADAGYQVFEAADADEAIAVLDQDREVRIVLTDIEMPGSMDGLRLAHYVRDRFPPTILVVTSGALNPAPGDLPADSFFVSKPFDFRRLLSRIENMAAA